MLRSDEEKLKVALTEAIDKCMDEFWENNTNSNLPWLGPATAEIMASAALAIIRTLSDTQEYLTSENLMKE